MQSNLLSIVQRGSDSLGFRFAILILTVLVFLFRQPDILTEGRFWAEEAYYFGQTWALGFRTVVFHSFNGYYSFFNWVVSGAAVQVPLEYAPLVTGYASLLVNLTPSALILFAPLTIPLSGWRRAIIALGLAMPNVNVEVWLNIINCQFWFALGAALLLIVDLRSRKAFLFALFYLPFAALTGPVSVLLTPIYLLRAWWSKDRRWYLMTAILGLGAALQSYVMVTAILASEREAALSPVTKGAAAFLRLFVYPFTHPHRNPVPVLLEHSAFRHMGLLFFLAAIIACFIAWKAYNTPRRAGLWLFAAMIFVTFVSVFGAYTGSGDPYVDIFHPVGGGRYLLAGSGLLLVLLLLPQERKSAWAEVGAAAFACLFLNFSIASYFHFQWSGVSWRQEVSDWRADPNDPIQVWPGKNWFFNFDPSLERRPPLR